MSALKQASLLLLAGLAGCGQVVHKPTVVKVPVPVACISAAPERPAFIGDPELHRMADYEFVLALGEDRVRRRQYEAELEAVIAPCLAPPTASPTASP